MQKTVSMNYKFIFLIAYFFTFLNLCLAQKNYSEGYIVTLNDDTIFGKIKDVASTFSMNARPIKISFIDREGKKESYKANNIKGYCKSEILKYITITDQNEGPFFAKVIIVGPVTLLAVDGVAAKSSNYPTIYFLRNKKTHPVSGFDFANDVSDYFKDYEELKELISNKALRFPDLEIIVIKYNKWYLNKLHGG
jgi:hypothetical protein